MKKGGLGRGLGALIKDSAETEQESQSGVTMVRASHIRANRWQPRRTFDDEALRELTASIQEHGVLQPLLVRTSDDGYELIAGERRLRASQAAGLETLPVLITDASDSDAVEIALIENLQREDLNILEEAEGYQTLGDEFSMTQEQIARRVGKSRASVANALRLLTLPTEIRQLVLSGDLSAGHAKIISGIDIEQEQLFFAQLTVREGLSVRELERRVKKARRAPRKPRGVRYDVPSEHMKYISDRLHTYFGTSVRVSPSRTYANGKKGKGSIEIDFYSNEELDRILEVLGLTED